MNAETIKTQLRKLTSNQNTIAFFLVIIAIVVIYFAYSYLVKKATTPIDIVYATENLKEKDEITPDKISTVSLSGSFVTSSGSGLLQTKSKVVNKYVKTGYFIPQGSLFYQAAIATGNESDKTYYGDIQDGYTVFDLDVDFHSTYGCSIMPGNYIDIYFKATDDENKLIFGLFIKSIQVKQVVNEEGLDVFKNTDDGDQLNPKKLMFAVSDELYELLKICTKLGYQLIPVPRNSSYSENASETEIASESIRNYVLSKSVIFETN